MKDIINLNSTIYVKCLVIELAPPHVQSAWGSRGKRVRPAGLAACYNYFSKKFYHIYIYIYKRKKIT